MKPIANQYKDLKEGKLSKQNFLTNVRHQLPDLVSPVNSFDDVVSILRNRRIINEDWETQQDLTGLAKDSENLRTNPETQKIAKAVANHSTLSNVGVNAHYIAKEKGITDSEQISHIIDLAASMLHKSKMEETEAGKKPFYLVDETGDVVDSTMAADETEARTYFENEYEGIGKSMMVVQTSDPAELQNAMYEKDIEGPGADAIDALQAGALHQEEEKDELEAAKQEAKIASEEGFVQHVNKSDKGYIVSDWYDSDSTVASYENGEQINESTFKPLKEGVEKPEGAYKKVTGKNAYGIFAEIDRINPYELKKGIEIEMGMRYVPVPNTFTKEFNPEALTRATKKVLKNLAKDPAFYTNAISYEFEKKSGLEQNPKDIKVGPDGEAKVKGVEKVSANTLTNLSKQERAKGKPEGVKEMKPSKKSMGGISTFKTNDKLPKGVELMKESHPSGQKYSTIDKNVHGFLHVFAYPDSSGNETKEGLLAWVQRDPSNREIYFVKSSKEAQQHAKSMREDFKPGVDLGASLSKLHKDVNNTDEQTFEELMKKYDWYYEMSDSSTVWERGANLDRTLKALAKKIGVEKAVEIFNKYAPANRKVTSDFFSGKSTMYEKLKEVVKQKIKEAMLTNPTTKKSVTTSTPAGTALAKRKGFTQMEPGGSDITAL